MADKNLSCFGWFFLDGMVDFLIVSFVVCRELIHIFGGGFGILGGNDFEGWILVFQELEDFMMGLGERLKAVCEAATTNSSLIGVKKR